MSDLMYGCRAVELTEGQSAWGARAIYRPDETWAVDVLPDRCDTTGPDVPALREHLGRVLPLPTLNRLAVENLPDGRSQDVAVIYDDEHVTVVASPQGSYGYLYITAVWKG